MDNAKAIIDNEKNEQSGLSLKLTYMVEDFVDLIKRKEQEELATKES